MAKEEKIKISSSENKIDGENEVTNGFGIQSNGKSFGGGEIRIVALRFDGSGEIGTGEEIILVAPPPPPPPLEEKIK